MSISGFSGPACREMRQLLGVYVVGAIDPAERALVDDHLGECTACRDELAGLAALPAMLSRVPVSEVEEMTFGPIGLPEPAEPSEEMLNSLLKRVAVKRKDRMWRSVAAVAAAAVIAAGGATAISQLVRPPAATQQAEVASGFNSANQVAAIVNYSPTTWGTAMRVQVTGIPMGTKCRFYVLSKDGKAYAGTWTVGQGYGNKTWYPASAQVSLSSVNGFEITSAATGKDLVTIHTN
ncbi:MAG TPA: zf-HC2 domain-containing protein [Streptosporangiaceae bacterium]|nr:zf-HC2 domain-containing protein [Streptosporangiaceae bacterium]